jgi:hypothetical protein
MCIIFSAGFPYKEYLKVIYSWTAFLTRYYQVFKYNKISLCW